jgi:uncharacterized protein
MKKTACSWRYGSRFLASGTVALTAVRVILVPGKKAGDWAEFGGLLGGAPVMAVNPARSDIFINRGGRIPAPLHSFRN